MSQDTNALKRVESYQYPRAHFGHLTPEQSAALDEFKELCQTKGYYVPAAESKTGLPSHDDETLLRYLRARKFSPDDAFTQFKDTEDWRKTNKIDELYDTVDVDKYDQARRLYPQWTGRRDKRGIPVYVFEVAGLTSKKMSEYEASTAADKDHTGNIPPKLRRLFALYENLTKFALPLCSGIPNRPYPDTPVSQSNNIVDISRVGLRQFWNLKGHMQDASQLATAHYPETLDRIFIIGAPSFFPTVWGWIKRWFDPVTVSKIFVLGQNEVKPTLEQYIDRENIPRKYGGLLDWEWGDLPSLEPAIQDALTWQNPSKGPDGSKSFPAGPIKWRETKDGAMMAIAVGSVQGRPREEQIASLPGKMANLEIPAVSVAAAVVPSTTGDPFGPPSTTGVHTHPGEAQEYFPKTGATPEDSRPQSPDMAQAAGTNLPTRSKEEMEKYTSHPRQGTSETRFLQQDQTHARGQLEENTPVSVHHGHGDRSTTMEPGTVGQAPKDVSVPEAKGSGPPPYLEQAQTAASNAFGHASTAVSAAGAGLMSAVGLGKKSEPEDKPATKEPPKDPNVDQMPNAHVEDFLRSNYTTQAKVGDRPIDKIDKEEEAGMPK